MEAKLSGREGKSQVWGKALSHAWTPLRQGWFLRLWCRSLVSQSGTKFMLAQLGAAVFVEWENCSSCLGWTWWAHKFDIVYHGLWQKAAVG